LILNAFVSIIYQRSWNIMPLEIITGPMFSGKSEELIRRVRRSIIAGLNVQVFKPVLDVRRGVSHVTTYDGIRIEATPVTDSKDFYFRSRSGFDMVAIDELQFFDEGIIDVVEDISRRCNVIASCLNLDFRGEAFPFKGSRKTVAELILRADKLDKFSAICTHKFESQHGQKICGQKAIFSQRIIDGKPAPYDAPTILLGSQEAYEARCRTHYQIPGKPSSLPISAFLQKID